MSGSTTVAPVAADAAQELKARGLHVLVDSQGGSAGGIAQLGAGEIDIAMVSKPIAPADRKQFPKVDFVTTPIGRDAVGIVVRRDVVVGGLDSISKDGLRRLFEGSVHNWRELGGPDLPVFVYDKEPGRGTREVLDKFMYEDGTAPPPATTGNYAIVGGNEEGRSKVLSTPGAVTPLSVAFAEGYDKLAVLAVDGVRPTASTVAADRYPLSRSLFLVTNGKPQGAAKTFVDFVLSRAGQQLVSKNGYLTVAQLAGS